MDSPPSQCGHYVQQLVSELTFVISLSSLKEIHGDTMEAKEESSSNDVLVLDMTYHFSWKRNVKSYIKKFGIWYIVINPLAPSYKKEKSITHVTSLTLRPTKRMLPYH